MNNKRIEVGDKVKVFFNHSRMIEGVMDYVPCEGDDIWIILDDQDERPIYVQTFDYMILIRKAKET